MQTTPNLESQLAFLPLQANYPDLQRTDSNESIYSDITYLSYQNDEKYNDPRPEQSDLPPSPTTAVRRCDVRDKSCLTDMSEYEKESKFQMYLKRQLQQKHQKNRQKFAREQILSSIMQSHTLGETAAEASQASQFSQLDFDKFDDTLAVKQYDIEDLTQTDDQQKLGFG